MFYVYEWYIVETGEIFYVGKGCKNRYKSTCHRNRLFDEFMNFLNFKKRKVPVYQHFPDFCY